MNIRMLVTLGPSSLNEEAIAGCDGSEIFVFRINLSHTPLEQLEETICTIRRYTDTPICLDTEGAQIRNQKMKNDEVYFEKDEVVKIHFEPIEGDSHHISFTPNFVTQCLRVGDVLNIDFHSARLRIVSVNRDCCEGVVVRSGKVGSNKAVDLNRPIELAPLTAKDEQAVEIGKKAGIRHFALSFAGCQQDVDLLRRKAGPDSYIISKVECLKGLQNLRSIIERTDAILIDRGDLSRQIPIEKIPFLQRRIVSLAKSTNTPVFVATNLLESMVTTEAPTRAEVNDVVSTLLMGADGLVLAAETAIGHYPIACVEMIRKLIEQYERWTPNTSIEELLMY